VFAGVNLLQVHCKLLLKAQQHDTQQSSECALKEGSEWGMNRRRRHTQSAQHKTIKSTRNQPSPILKGGTDSNKRHRMSESCNKQ
jgi:hypothetical protein